MCLYLHFLSLPKRTKSDRLIQWVFFVDGATAPSGPGRTHYRGFTITLRHTTLSRTPLDEWSARRRGDLTTHNQRQTSTPPTRFEPTIPASEQPQTHALDGMAILSARMSVTVFWISVNPVKPSGHYMYHQFNIQEFYVLPTQCVYVFFVGLRTNSDCFPVQH